MLELYTHPMSPCAQKVRLVLAEKAVDYTKRHVNLPEKENLRPEYLKLNPAGVVPTLVHDGRPIVESSIICEYLEDCFPEPALRAADPYEIARMRLWMKHVDNKLHPSCGALQWPLVMRPKLMELPEAEREAILDRVPEKQRRERQKRLVKMGLDAPDVADAVGVYAQTIVDMEDVLRARPWMSGDMFSITDCCLAPYFQTLIQFGWTALFEDGHPRVSDWVARVQARPSYEVAIAGDLSDEVRRNLAKLGAPGWARIEAHLRAA